MIGGYTLFYFEKPPKLSSVAKILFTILATIFGLILVFGVWNNKLNIYETALYVSLGHTGNFNHNFFVL